jgi:hypothetical protein
LPSRIGAFSLFVMAHVRAADLNMRTTSGGEHDFGAAQVVVGYGIDPAAAVSSLRHAAKSAALAMVDGLAYEIVGVTLTAGQVPDVSRVAAELGARHATIAGWVAYGTLRAVA